MRDAVPMTETEPMAAPLRGLAAAIAAIGLYVAVGLALVVVFFTCLFPINVVDFWWQAKTGELIVRSGGIPSRDPFSWTAAGQPWVVHEWLTEVFFYLLATRAPAWMLLAYKCGLAVVACGIVMAHAASRTRSLALGIAAGLGTAWVMRNYADLRPQMMTFILLATLMWGLHEYREGRCRRLPLVLPLVMILWSNLHGGVVVGLLLVWLWIGGDALGGLLPEGRSTGLPKLALGGLASLVAVAVNPNGFHVYLYPFQVLGHPEVRDYISEWFAPNFHSAEMRAFMLVLLSLLGVALVRRPSPRRVGEALVLTACGYAALISQRNTVPFAIVATPVIAAGVAELWRDTRMTERILVPAIAPAVRAVAAWCLVLLLVGHLSLVLPRASEWDSSAHPSALLAPASWVDYAIGRPNFPEAAVREMERGAWPGRIYNDYIWGGYLIWRLYGKRPVFVDGRAEVYYPTRAFEDEMHIHNVQTGWDQVLDRRGVDVVLTSRTGYLAQSLSRHGAWMDAFTGPVEKVFVRRGSAASGDALPPIPEMRP